MSNFKVYDNLNPSVDSLPTTSLLSTVASRIGTLEADYYACRAGAALKAGTDFASAPNGTVQVASGWNLARSGGGDYLWIFAKTLEHDRQTLLPKRSQCDQLLDYFIKPTFAKLVHLPSAQGSQRKLEDPTGGLGFEPICKPQALISASQRMDVSSPHGPMEMTEVYCMAMMRDLPISALDISVDPTSVSTLPRRSDGTTTGDPVTAATILSIMNQYTGDSVGVKPNWPINDQGLTDMGLLFRGHGSGQNLGQYVSQLLILDVPFGSALFEQKFAPENDSTASVTVDGYLAIQEGIPTGAPPKAAIPSRRVQYLRDLGSLVHSDPAYGLYFNASLIALKAGLDALVNSGQGSNFLDTGGPDFLTSLAAVTRPALRTAWVTKWQAAMQLRPEAVAARLSWYEMAATKPPELATWVTDFSTELKTTVKAWTGSLGSTPESVFLPLLYDEGSPVHPSFPAGHAAVAGACVTIMKAFLKTHTGQDYTRVKWASVFGNIKKVSSTDTLENTVDSGETLVGEMNKLASNVALGRNIAGVHARCDGDCGLAMGEEVAVSYLVSMTKEYYPDILRDKIAFTLERFSGELIKIADGEVTTLVTNLA